MIGRFFAWVGCVALMVAAAGCGSMPVASAAGSTPDVAEPIPEEPGKTPELVVTPVSGASMRVLWTVTSYIIGRNASWGETEAQALLFKGLDINETEIIFDGQVCSGVSFQVEKVNAADFLLGAWQVTTEDLGVPDEQVQVVRTTCDLPGFKEYLRLSDRRLVVPMEGVFFFFEPTAIQ